MTERWSDLSALDPERDPERWNALLRRTRAAAADELARRAFAAAWPVAPLARWVRPALSLAAALVVMAAGWLALADRSQAQSSTLADGTVAEAMGVPTTMSGYVEPGGGARADALLLPLSPEQR